MPSFRKPSFLHTKQHSVSPLLPASVQDKELARPSSPSSSSTRARPTAACRRVLVGVVLLAALGLVASQFVRLHVQVRWVGDDGPFASIDAAPGSSALGAGNGGGKRVVSESAPHSLLRHSLIPGVRYATTAPAAGLTNQIIDFVELLRYGQMSNRVPILGDFVAYPIIRTYPHPPAPQISFDTIFDLAMYEQLSGQQVTTFSRLKLPSSPVEALPCFSTSSRQGFSPVKGVVGPDDVGIEWAAHPSVDIDVWESPVAEPFGHALRLESLVDFSESKGGAWERWVDGVLDGMTSEERAEVRARPEQDLVCWADMYWGSEDDNVNVFQERWHQVWPAWQTAGRHLHFAPPLRRQADAYLKHIMGDEVRPFIAIHARHGDFGCPESASTHPHRPDSSASSCFRSPSSYIPAVSHLITSLAELKDAVVQPADVLLFSDEEDESWWAEVAELGWKRADHRLMGTKERWDNWYPTLLDMVMMSSAKGFIGTPGSTYSLFAALRVKDWNDGLATEESR